MLVDGDPTTDILATRNISRVWKDGREVDRDAIRHEIHAAKKRPSIELPPSVLRTFAGRYDFGQQIVFAISVKENRLYMDLPNGKSFPITASSPLEFFSNEVGVELQFEKNGGGAVISVLVIQGDEKRRGKRIE